METDLWLVQSIWLQKEWTVEKFHSYNTQITQNTKGFGFRYLWNKSQYLIGLKVKYLHILPCVWLMIYVQQRNFVFSIMFFIMRNMLSHHKMQGVMGRHGGEFFGVLLTLH